MRRDLLWTLVPLALLTLLFWLLPLDFWLQDLFWDPTPRQFARDDNPFWHFLYHYGIFFGYAVAVAALVLISLSYWDVRWLQTRKAAVVLVLTVCLGPGLLVNLVFKDHWGRPRPREVVQYGGTEAFVAVAIPGPDGKSFPCGHCSMGFFLAVPFLFWRRNRPRLAWAALGTGIVMGLLLGYARVRVGAHWPSDVVWAGFLVWLVAVGLYHALRVWEPIPIPQTDTATQRRRARRMTIALGIALPVLTAGLMLATPYISSKAFQQPLASLPASVRVLDLSLGTATVYLEPGHDTLAVRYRVNAFGFPNSKLRGEHAVTDTALTYAIQAAGWFTEIRNQVWVRLPADTLRACRIHVTTGKLLVDLAQLPATGNLSLVLDQGTIVVSGRPAAGLDVQATAPAYVGTPPVTTAPAGAPRLRLRFHVKAGQIEYRP